MGSAEWRVRCWRVSSYSRRATCGSVTSRDGCKTGPGSVIMSVLDARRAVGRRSHPHVAPVRHVVLDAERTVQQHAEWTVCCDSVVQNDCDTTQDGEGGGRSSSRLHQLSIDSGQR